MNSKRINYILFLLSSCKEQLNSIFKDINYLKNKNYSNNCLRNSLNYLKLSKNLLYRFNELFILLLSKNNINNVSLCKIKQLYLERSYYNISICKTYYIEYLSSTNNDEKKTKYNIQNKINCLQKTLENVIKNIELI